MTESDYVSAADVYNELGVLIEALGGMVRDGRLSVDRDTERDLASTVRTTGQRVIDPVQHILTRTQPATPPSPADAALDALEAEIDQRIGIAGRPREEARPAPSRSVRAQRAAAALTTRHDHGIALGR